MKSDRRGIFSRGLVAFFRAWKPILLGLMLILITSIAALWIASFRSKVLWSWHANAYMGTLGIDHGSIKIDAYREESEDDFYWQRSLPLRDIEVPLMLLAAGLIWHMRAVKSHHRARGFEVCV
jgi:hypothetical protein